ncbi:MAG: FMN-binding negative transcriptional regulator [Burkholderiales bacterium]|jgi:transcriptional regulator|nr:FMN-binding negative transcriptional regulator [Burkholderiales bacterium]
MLYQPAHFKVEQRQAALAVMREHPLATLVSVGGGEPLLTHAPLVALERDGAVRLLGHLARANPHWRSWVDGARLTAIFHGPDGYVSPSWYERREAVPTWNYVVVHAHGTVTVTHDSAAKERILKALIDAHDPPYRRQWDEMLAADFRERQKSAIVGFEIAVDRIDAKFKLSQNRPPADRANVLAAMQDADPARRALARWMRELAIAGERSAP